MAYDSHIVLPEIKERLSRVLPFNVPDSPARKRESIAEALASRGDVDAAVAEVVLQVPREKFVRQRDRSLAHDDCALSIGHGQTISQPSLVAHMISELKITKNTDRILDVGCGSGYQAAILSRLADSVIAVERVPELADAARIRLEELGYSNVQIELAADDILGYPKSAPYDGIIVGASVPSIPQSLVDQLGPGGRLVIPVGDRMHQKVATLVKNERDSSVSYGLKCVFVPLIGPEAW